MIEAKMQEQRYHQHTANSAYLLYPVALACVFYDSTQGIVQKYELNRKWYYLWGTICFFAYLYLRPLFSKGIGSASSGFINLYSVYISWLCGAVFLHLPSLEALGFNIKADVSVLLVVFLVSVVALGSLHALHAVAVMSKALSPSLYNPLAGRHAMTSLVLLNSFNLAIACSTYYGFCGNAAATDKDSAASGGDFKAAICGKWLHPIGMNEHPMFSRWVIYGEAAAHDSGLEPPMAYIDIPLDGRGFIAIPAAQTISPVFTLWLTLIIMYLVNSLADYSAAATLQTGYTSDLRKTLMKATRIRMQRAHSAEAIKLGQSQMLSKLPSRALEMMQRSQSSQISNSVSTMVRNMSTRLPSLGSHTLGSMSKPPRKSLEGGLPPVRTKPSEPEVEIAASDEQPDFMPMFPWYSGTSADMYKTVFDLMISVKLFLGRFDMRTMQAATAAMPPGTGTEPPREGDGFTFEHLADRDSLWLDFSADVGDGGDPTYAVAASMAAPLLHVNVPDGLPGMESDKVPDLKERDAGSNGSDTSSGLDSPPASPRPDDPAPPSPGARLLPRGDLLIIGGDLAYPNPSNETYETRFFRPYEAAMPPPPHVMPGALVVQKPDLPSLHSHREAVGGCRKAPSSLCDKHASACAPDPRHTRSCRACHAVQALRSYDGPTCFAIPGNHDWIDGLETYQRHIQHRGWLGGWLLPQENSYFALHLPQGWWLFGLDLALLDDIDLCQCRYFARIADERMGPDDAVILVTHQPRWLMDWFWQEAACPNLRQLVRGHLRGRARVHLSGDLHFYMRHSFCPAPPADSGLSPTSSTIDPGTLQQLSPKAELGRRGKGTAAPKADRLGRMSSGGAGPGAAHLQASEAGLGGAFLHPTHVFTSARFGSIPEASPEAAFTRGSSPRASSRERGPFASKGSSPKGSTSRGASPSRRRRSRRAPSVDLGPGTLEDGGASKPGAGGEFCCAAAYPSAATSLRLGRLNLHVFRLKNNRFDIIGGALYFLLTVSVLPRCGQVASVLDAPSLPAAAAAFASAALDTAAAIVLESYLSLAALCFLVLMSFGFARAGGVGAAPHQTPHPPDSKTDTFWTALALRARSGGLQTQLVFACMHAFTHFAAAVLLMMLLELGVETCIKYEGLGAEGYHSLFSWYQRFEAQHFPDPMGMRELVSRWTGHIYPSVLKFSFALFDVPEAIAVSRIAVCKTGLALTRIQAASYYMGMLAYYWVLATPPVGFLFGCYLYIAVNWFHVHYDEAFSALRIPHFKGFSRLHISPSGDLHIYSLAMDKVPSEWKEDPRWRGRTGAGSRRGPSHAAQVPSRWVPVHRSIAPNDEHFPKSSDSGINLVDYVRVPKRRQF
ncbi:hypothetical protein WJX73_005806 [Symbiochloris irregularis]|uniref:Calcineurin-like phosphoesterase domain-containing protein n=1 Tax=Symbiochloris irregularis TaxID=706552 RepID=A0AAW1PLN7_9CHLO